MCGLFGMVGDAGHETDLPDALKQLAFVSSFRGKDSTGLGAIRTKSGLYSIVKAPVTSVDFLEMRGADNILSQANTYSAIIGHTRAATRGVVNKANAHPFFEEGADSDVILAHNGFAEGYDSKAYNVDSQWVAAQIAEKGSDFLTELRGEYALTWYSFAHQSIFMARNSKRPLFVADIRAGAQTKRLWASEEDMLRMVCKRNNVYISAMWELEPHVLYQLDPMNAKLVSATPYKAPEPSWNYRSSAWDDGASYSRGYKSPVVTTVPATLPTPPTSHVYQQGAKCALLEKNAAEYAIKQNKLPSVVKCTVMQEGAADINNNIKYTAAVVEGDLAGEMVYITAVGSTAQKYMASLFESQELFADFEVFGVQWKNYTTGKVDHLTGRIPVEKWNDLTAPEKNKFTTHDDTEAVSSWLEEREGMYRA